MDYFLELPVLEFPYTFYKTINKIDAFVAQAKAQTGYSSMSYNNGQLTMNMDHILTDAELDKLTAFVEGYVDPAVYLLFNSAISYPLSSNSTNSTILVPVQNIIYQNQNTANLVMDSMKTVLVISSMTPNLLSDPSYFVEMQVMDKTRNVLIYSGKLDVTSLVTGWPVMSSGQNTVRSWQLYGLGSKTPSYDVIFQFSMRVSNPNLTVQLNALQFLFYTPV